jgi:hypothetical protein
MIVIGSYLLGFLLARGKSLRICRRDLIRVTGVGFIAFMCTVVLGYESRTLAAVTPSVIADSGNMVGALNLLRRFPVRQDCWSVDRRMEQA